MTRFLYAAACAILCFFRPCALEAIEVWPITQTIDGGVAAEACITVINTGEQAAPISIDVYQRIQDSENSTCRDAHECFIITPQRFFLKPGGTQVVKIAYTKEPPIDAEEAYRIAVRQPAVSSKVGTDIVYVMPAIFLNMYVAGNKHAAEISVDTIDLKKEADGSSIMSIAIRNKGNVHTILDTLNIVVQSVDNREKMISLTIQDLPDFQKTILAEGVLIAHIPWPADLPLGSVTWHMRYAEKDKKNPSAS